MVPRGLGTVAVALLLAVLLVVGPAALEAQDETDRRRNLVQKPLAVAKLVDRGYPGWQVRKLVTSLNEAGVSVSDFNALLGSLPHLAGMLSSLEGAVNHVVLKQERGMTEDELVDSVRTELGEQQLPWESALPANDGYLGDPARNLISRVKESIRDRRGFEEGEPQPAETEPGSRQPGGPTPGPSPGPGPGPGGPNRPGSNQPF